MASIQMELKRGGLQLCWKPAQKKNSQNQIVIYGLVPRFNPKGVMRELVYGLKESKKELCDAKTFFLTENVDQRDRALPLFNEYFKQATAPKALSQSESKEMLLNKNKEYTENGCRLFHLKYDPADNARMDPVWNQFIPSGQSKLVLGHRAKVYLLPNPGHQNPSQIILIRQYMKFHRRYTNVSRILAHPTVTNLDKPIKVSMVDGTIPPCKFTTLRHKYMDLRTSESLPVFHAVMPRMESPSCGPLINCLYLNKNHMAKDFAQKIAVCPSA